MPKIKDKDRLLNKLSELMVDADIKSQQLDFSHFKQYFDEVFSPRFWEIVE